MKRLKSACLAVGPAIGVSVAFQPAQRLTNGMPAVAVQDPIVRA